MSRHATITVNRPREDLERLWASAEHRPEHIERADARVTFEDAPGDRGTEIHVDFEAGGRLRRMGRKLTGSEPRAKVMDDLRRFKQQVETGETAR